MKQTLEMRLGDEERVVNVDDGDVILLGRGEGVDTWELTEPNRMVIHLAENRGAIFQDMVPDADYVVLPQGRYHRIGLAAAMTEARVADVRSKNGIVVSNVSSELVLMVLDGNVHAGTTFDSQGMWGATGGAEVPTYYGDEGDLVEVNGSLYGARGEQIDLTVRDRPLECEVKVGYIDPEERFVEQYGAPYLIRFPNNNIGSKGNGLLGPIRLVTPQHTVIVVDPEMRPEELRNLTNLYHRAQREARPDPSMDAALASSYRMFRAYKRERERPAHSRRREK